MFSKAILRQLSNFTGFYVRFTGLRFYAVQALELFNSSTKGFGILMILPLLSLAGYLENPLPNGPLEAYLNLSRRPRSRLAST